MNKIKENPDIVKITWVDSNGSNHWVYKDQITTKVSDIITCGYFLQENEECYTICQSVGQWSYGNPITIAKVCVTNFEILVPAKKKKRK